MDRLHSLRTSSPSLTVFGGRGGGGGGGQEEGTTAEDRGGSFCFGWKLNFFLRTCWQLRREGTLLLILIVSSFVLGATKLLCVVGSLHISSFFGVDHERRGETTEFFISATRWLYGHCAFRLGVCWPAGEGWSDDDCFLASQRILIGIERRRRQGSRGVLLVNLGKEVPQQERFRRKLVLKKHYVVRRWMELVSSADRYVWVISGKN